MQNIKFSSSKFLPLIFGLVLVGYPLVAGVSLLTGLPNRALSIGLRGFIVFVSLYFIAKVVAQRNAFTRNSIYWVCVAIIVVGYSYRFYEDVWGGGYIYKDPIVMTGIAIGSSLLPFLAFSTENMFLKNRQNLYVVYFFALSAGVLQLLQSGALLNNLADTHGRLGVNTFNAIGVSQLGAVIATLSTFILFSTGSSALKTKLIYLFGVLIGLILLMLGGSRGPLFAFILSMVLYYSSIDFSIRKIGGLFIAGLAGTFFVLLAKFFQDYFNSSALDRFVNVFNFDSASSQSTSARLNAIEGSWAQFLESPIFGSTIIEPSTSFYPHNVLLELLMSIGVFGGIAFLGLLYFSFIGALRIYRYQYGMFWIVLLYLQQLILSQTSGAVWGASNFWVLLTVLVLSGNRIGKNVHRPVRASNRNRARHQQ